MANIDTYITKGTDIREALKGAAEDAKKIGDEFKEVKDGLSDMPGGLDSDLVDMIKAAEDQGKGEATADIEGIKSSAVADAKKNVDSIKSDVTQKISDNQTAKSQISSIRSKYGKAALDSASAAIDQNTNRGNDLMKMLDDAVNDANNTIQNIKNSL